MDTLLKTTIIILHESSVHDNFNLTYGTNTKTGQGYLIQTDIEDHVSTGMALIQISPLVKETQLYNAQNHGLFLNNGLK